MVQLQLNPERFYTEKLNFEKEMKISNENDLIECRKELLFLVGNRKFNIKRYIIDGAPTNRAVKLWEDEVYYTRRFCQMYNDEIKESEDEIAFYTKKLNELVE